MVANDADRFEGLVAEAQTHRFCGWDFSWPKDRLVEESPPWDYKQEVAKELPNVKSLLDLGTGGGELLSSLGPLPGQTYVTEGHPPNASIARARLRPLGIDVVLAYAEDNTKPQSRVLPFRAGALGVCSARSHVWPQTNLNQATIHQNRSE